MFFNKDTLFISYIACTYTNPYTNAYKNDDVY